MTARRDVRKVYVVYDDHSVDVYAGVTVDDVTTETTEEQRGAGTIRYLQMTLPASKMVRRLTSTEVAR